MRVSESERAPRSYRHVTTLGRRKRRPMRCASLHASCRTRALPEASGDAARSLASPHARDATPRSASRVPSLKMAARARATPGTRNCASCASAASDRSESPARANASAAQSRNRASALGMSGLVKSLARRYAARSRTIPGSERYLDWHRSRMRMTTGGASASPFAAASPPPSTSLSTVTRSKGMRTRMESHRMRTARVSHAVPSSSASSIVLADSLASCDRTRRWTTGSRSFASCGKNLHTVLYPRTVANAWRTEHTRWTRIMSASSPRRACARSTAARGAIHASRWGSNSWENSWYRSTMREILA